MARSQRPMSHRPITDAVEDLPYCRICRREFRSGKLTGWHAHVGQIANHPAWHPEITDPEQRATLYRAEFPEFWASARTPSVRVGGGSPAPRLPATTAQPTDPAPPPHGGGEPVTCPCCRGTGQVSAIAALALETLTGRLRG